MANNTITVVFQSVIKRNNFVNKEEKSNEAISDIKASLRNISVTNEKIFESNLENNDSSKSSSKLDSVKRISQIFEREVLTELNSKSESKTKFSRKSRDVSATSELQNKIKAYEVKIKKTDDVKKDLIKRKSESQFETRQTVETNKADTQLTIALSKSKRLPLVEIDESIIAKNDAKLNKVQEEKINIKNIWINNEKKIELDNEPKKAKQQLKNTTNQKESDFESYSEENIDKIKSKEHKNVSDTTKGNVKSIIFQYQNNIEKNLEKDKERKTNFYSVDKEFKKNSKKSVQNTIKEERPISIELIQSNIKANNIIEAEDLSSTNSKGKNISSKKTDNLRKIAVIKVIEKESDQSDSNEVSLKDSNVEISKQTPSSSIKNIIRNAKLDENIAANSNNNNNKKEKVEIITTKSLNNKKKDDAGKVENLSFKEELQRKLLKKSGPKEDENIYFKEKNSLATNMEENVMKNFEIKNKIKSENLNDKDDFTTPLVFKYTIGKKSKEEEMTDWVSVDKVTVKAKGELDLKMNQMEKKKMLNQEFLKSFGKKNISNEEESPIVDKPDYPMDDEPSNDNNNHILTQNKNHKRNQKYSQDVFTEGNRDISKYKIDNDDDSQLERFIAKHLEKENKLTGKNSSKHGATRMRSHNRPNVSEYFRVDESKIIPNGIIANTALENDVPVPDYD